MNALFSLDRKQPSYYPSREGGAMRLVLLTMLFVVCVSEGWAQDRPTVAVTFSGDDLVGSRLAYEVKELLGRSALYRFSTDTEQAQFTVRIVSMDNALTKGLSSAVAVALTARNELPFRANNPQSWYPAHLTHILLLVGADKITTMTGNLVASLDETITDYRRSNANVKSRP